MLVNISSLWALSDISSRRQLGNKVSEVWEEAISPHWPNLRLSSGWHQQRSHHREGSHFTGGDEAGAEERWVPKHMWDTSSPIIPGKYYDMPWGRAVVQAE